MRKTSSDAKQALPGNIGECELPHILDAALDQFVNRTLPTDDRFHLGDALIFGAGAAVETLLVPPNAAF